MRALVLLISLAGCNLGDWFGGPFGDCDPAAWGEQEVARTRAGAIFVATRDGCGFPDAVTDFRLYYRGDRFAEGDMETKHWVNAIERRGNGFLIRLYDQRCVFDDVGLRCVRCHDDAACYPND